jgi:hypothetical protein
MRGRHTVCTARRLYVDHRGARSGAIFAKLVRRVAAVAAPNACQRNRYVMDASIYFRLTDRIDGAASLEELAAIVAEIERTQPHMIERRALERRMNRRESALSGASV